MAEKGKVKFYNWKKGFGFVTTDSGEDLFLHRTGIPKGIKVYTNDVVEFDIIEGPKGKNATNITVISSEGPQPSKRSETKEDSEDSYESDEEPQDSEDFGDEEDK
jgi:cold shock protein